MYTCKLYAPVKYGREKIIFNFLIVRNEVSIDVWLPLAVFFVHMFGCIYINVYEPLKLL